MGISLDEDHKAWASATRQLGITWPQMSDLHGWRNQAATMFNVTSIPYTIVVDSNGKILAKELRGKELRDFVEKSL